MSKELTEKMENGELDGGFYYTKSPFGTIVPNPYKLVKNSTPFAFGLVDEVLAPVPSYEELQKLKEQLRIATKALKEYANCKPTEWMSCVTADIALKEMECVK